MNPIRNGVHVQDVLETIRDDPGDINITLSPYDAACVLGMVDEWHERISAINKNIDKLNKTQRRRGR
jgi:hypothetical protein